MLALEDHRLLAERGLGAGQVIHAEPGQQGDDDDERHPDETGVLQPQLTAIGQHLRLATEHAEQAEGNHQRYAELHDRDAEVTQAGIQAQGRALLRLGVEETDVGHARGEVAAAEAAQQGNHHEHAVGRARVLHGKAHPQRWRQQRGGAQGGPAPTAEDRHHERIEHPEGRPREPRQGRQPEQLVGAESKADGVQAHDHRAPHHPHGKGQQQCGNRNPQVAGGGLLAATAPERGIFRAPVVNHRAFVRRVKNRHGLLLGQCWKTGRRPLEAVCPAAGACGFR
ncbi:hypothetical protein D9M71_535690 [compost metagenome]